MRVVGLCFKDVVARFKGREVLGPNSTWKVVRVEGVHLGEIAFGIRRRPMWVLQAMRGRRILFEKKFKTRREATTVARQLAFGRVDFASRS